MRRWIRGMAVGSLLGLLGCGAEPEPKRASPAIAREPGPVLPASIGSDDEQCRSCELSKHGVCELLWRYGCGPETTCGAEIACDPECCRREGVAIRKLQAHAETGAVEGLGVLVPLGRSSEIEGVLHHRRVEHLVGMHLGEQRVIYWYVESSFAGDELRTSAIWRVSTESSPALVEGSSGSTDPITDLELAGESLLFTQFSAEDEQTSVRRLPSVGGKAELLGSWPGPHTLRRTDEGVRLVSETGVAGDLIGPMSKQQVTVAEDVVDAAALARCKAEHPGEPPDLGAVRAFGEHMFWVTLLDPQAWKGLGVGHPGLLRHCRLASGEVETLGLLQLPERPGGEEAWGVEFVWTDPLLGVAFADGVSLAYVERPR